MSNTNTNVRMVSLGSLGAQLPFGARITTGTGSQWELRKSFEEGGPTYLISLTKDIPTLTLEQAAQFYINGENLHVTLPDTRGGERLDVNNQQPLGG